MATPEVKGYVILQLHYVIYSHIFISECKNEDSPHVFFV